MRARHLSFVLALTATIVAGCADEESVSAEDEDVVAASRDPLAMPKPILTFLQANDWGNHHLEWHTVRQWDRLGASDQAWAKRQHWGRADVQEGQKGNGLEFLAMHRVMIRMLRGKFLANGALFDGWHTPPTECSDQADPCGPDSQSDFDPAKLAALDKLQNHLDDFKSDDDLGLYIETSLRPTAQDPNARATDKSAGLHNYLHNRFMDAHSKIDIGDPSVNLQNMRFWRLHGWIEGRWTAYRTLKHRSDDDPSYKAAIKKGEDMLALRLAGPVSRTPPEPAPESLRKFFAQDP